MAIWSLEVNAINKDSPDWAASTYKGTLVIRAKDQDRARELATLECGLSTTNQESTRHNPWSSCSKLVKCEQLVKSDYKEEGEEKILEPRKFRPQVFEEKRIQLMNEKMKEHLEYEPAMRVEMDLESADKPSGWIVIGGNNANGVAQWAAVEIEKEYDVRVTL